MFNIFGFNKEKPIKQKFILNNNYYSIDWNNNTKNYRVIHLNMGQIVLENNGERYYKNIEKIGDYEIVTISDYETIFPF
jgi:hypothetical protein